MRTAKIKINKKEYLLCFSARVMRDCSERYGNAENIGKALTEGTETVLPTAPQAAYQVDGQPVAAWRMVIVSTTRGGVIGDADYFAALEKAAPYRLDGRADAVLLRGLTAEELEGLMD